MLWILIAFQGIISSSPLAYFVNYCSLVLLCICSAVRASASLNRSDWGLRIAFKSLFCKTMCRFFSTFEVMFSLPVAFSNDVMLAVFPGICLCAHFGLSVVLTRLMHQWRQEGGPAPPLTLPSWPWGGTKLRTCRPWWVAGKTWVSFRLRRAARSDAAHSVSLPRASDCSRWGAVNRAWIFFFFFFWFMKDSRWKEKNRLKTITGRAFQFPPSPISMLRRI